MSDDRIYHISTAGEWAAAQTTGQYRAASLSTEGFIHCSTRAQVLATAARYYRGVHGLVLLEIDPSRVAVELRYEVATNAERFPHLYGALNLDAVVAVMVFEPGDDGLFSWPERSQPRG